MRIIIFGTGNIYEKYKNDISSEDEIIAFIDNAIQKQGSILDGKPIFAPKSILNMKYDRIVVMSISDIQMKEQLLHLGCDRKRIWHCQEYLGRNKKPENDLVLPHRTIKDKKRCLIITNPLGYHGGALSAVYAALALKTKGYEVYVAAEKCDGTFQCEFQSQGINFLIAPNLQFAGWENLKWTSGFDKILVNTYPMIFCASEIAKHHKTALWLHESDICYSGMRFWNDISVSECQEKGITLYAVSEKAKKNFIRHAGAADITVLPYGIPDICRNSPQEFSGGEKGKDGFVTFAVIGTLHPIKRQDIFIKAIKLLRKEVYEQARFLIIGKRDDPACQDYEKMIKQLACGIHNIQFTGELSRREMINIFTKIDVVVVASEQETMSIAATEAMMNSKVCIVSSTAGIAEIIEDRVNGRLFELDDTDELAKIMEECIVHKDELWKMEGEARKTYEKYFTMEQFADRLEQI
ncbi:glycosyltransferase [bacterium 1XD42-94]|nr:glycosyltransferase [bacterium 1XD42-76]NBK06932.1 glycosyltransferase [bacterium 1XD42-94]